MRRSSGLVIPLALLALGACGDNITVGGIDAPGPTIDSDPDQPDAMVDAMTANPAMRAMTLAVNDVEVVDPEVVGIGGVRGGSITITFSDLTMNGGITVGAGMSPIGGCQVVEFSPANPPNPTLDAGAVTIANEPPGETPPTGLVKTVGPCTFMGAAGYRCISHGGMGVAANATNLPAPNPAGLIAYTIPNQMIGSASLVGSYLNINGFPDAEFNSGASAFPVVSQMTGTLIVVNPAGEAGTTSATAAAGFAVLNGFAPVPGAGAGANFLDAGSIRITKAADPDWGALDNVIGIIGEGFVLDGPSADPADIPLTAPAAAIEFGCDNDTPAAGDDTCGDTGTSNTLTATIISGRSTQKALTGLAPFQMPTEVPGTDTWREWQCAGLLSKRMTLTADALDHILGNEAGSTFVPTRVEVRVLYVAGAQLNGPNPGDAMQGRILAGHGVVGHTDP